MKVEKPELVNALATVLGDSFVFAMKAQGAHWNVTGPDFSANHAFFAEIYEDVDGSIDAIAESMRKLGAPAPAALSDMIRLSNISDFGAGSSFIGLCSDLHAANDIILEDINQCFRMADAMDEQGIADLMAARDDMHKKWRWQLAASLNMEHEG